MTNPSEIIARYRTLPFGSDSLGDYPENHAKIGILQNLNEHANGEVVIYRLQVDNSQAAK